MSAPNDQPASGQPDPGETPPPPAASLSRLRVLAPYAWPIRWYLIGSGAAALASVLAGLAIPLITQRIIDGPIAGHDLGQLAWLVGLIVLLGLFAAAMLLLRRLLLARPVPRMERRMRADLYAHLQRLPVAFHDRWQSGQLLSRAISDLTVIRRFLAFGGTFLVVSAITCLVGLVVLFWLAPLFGLVMLLMMIPLVALSYRYESQYKVAARRAQDQVGDLATVVEESVLGIRVLKAFGRGPTLTRRFMADAGVLRGTELTKVRVLSILWSVLIALPEAALAAMLAIGAWSVAKGTMTPGTLVAGLSMMVFLRWPIEAMGWLLAEASNAASATQRFSEVFAWSAEHPDSVITEPARPRPLSRPVRGHLRLSGVHFRYPGADVEILRGVDRKSVV